VEEIQRSRKRKRVVTSLNIKNTDPRERVRG